MARFILVVRGPTVQEVESLNDWRAWKKANLRRHSLWRRLDIRVGSSIVLRRVLSDVERDEGLPEVDPFS